MKLGSTLFLVLMLSGCSLFTEKTVVQESYFVPVIRSDISSAGYIPSVTPNVNPGRSKERPRIYTPVLR
ncbi:hypothetical protein [Marinomonas epiphytica]